MTSKAQLRQTLRARRRALSTQQQSIAARGIIKQLNKLASFRKARHIACYLENDGELGTQPLRRDCQGRGIACYLPVVHAEAGHFSMRFHHHRHGQSLRSNRFGIAEPNAWRSPAMPAPFCIVKNRIFCSGRPSRLDEMDTMSIIHHITKYLVMTNRLTF